MLFFKKKKKVNPALEESFAKVVDEINNLDDKDNPKKIEHYIIESCDHILSTAKEVEAASIVFGQLSDYLSDIEIVLRMDDSTRTSIAEYAENIKKLTKRKQDFKESDRRLDDDTYFLMQEHEDSVVEDIHRMEANEKYKSKIESDIRYLEAEKSRWEIEKDSLKSLLKKLRIASLSVFAVITVIVCSWLVIPKEIMNNIRLVMIIILFLGVLAAFLIFLTMGRKRKEYRKSIKNLNQYINLLNIERMRFVNVNKALQYELDIYAVKSSGELTYIWEQYMLMVKEQEQYRKNNLDLTYYIDRLYKLFKALNLKYERKWIEQLPVMLNEKQLRGIKIKITDRRQIIREQIHSNTELIKSERGEVDRMMRDYNFYVPEVLKITEEVDRFCANLRI